jgi:hypothetical protein
VLISPHNERTLLSATSMCRRSSALRTDDDDDNNNNNNNNTCKNAEMSTLKTAISGNIAHKEV